MEHWSEYSRFFISLLVILDPFLAIPLFLELTRDHDESSRKRVARLATLTVLLALVATAITGGTLLAWLGTSLGAFRVGGGIVLFLMAHGMLKTRVENVQNAGVPRLPPHHTSEAVVPLAIPLLAGPGAMSTVILAMQRSSTLEHAALVLLIIIAVSLVLWLVLSLARPIGQRLGDTGLNIMNRVFGLLLTAIAVEVVANGLKQIFPVLAG